MSLPCAKLLMSETVVCFGKFLPLLAALQLLNILAVFPQAEYWSGSYTAHCGSVTGACPPPGDSPADSIPAQGLMLVQGFADAYMHA